MAGSDGTARGGGGFAHSPAAVPWPPLALVSSRRGSIYRGRGSGGVDIARSRVGPPGPHRGGHKALAWPSATWRRIDSGTTSSSYARGPTPYDRQATAKGKGSPAGGPLGGRHR